MGSSATRPSTFRRSTERRESSGSARHGPAGFLRAALVGLVLVSCTRVEQVSYEGLDAKPYDERRFGEIPDFALVERSGRTITRADLLGSPWIANLFFASCAGPCPRVQA